MTNAGVRVLRRLTFEEPAVVLRPRTDVHIVEFESQTRPHADGLLLDVVLAPSLNPVGGPVTLTFDTASLRGDDRDRAGHAPLAHRAGGRRRARRRLSDHSPRYAPVLRRHLPWALEDNPDPRRPGGGFAEGAVRHGRRPAARTPAGRTRRATERTSGLLRQDGGLRRTVLRSLSPADTGTGSSPACSSGAATRSRASCAGDMSMVMATMTAASSPATRSIVARTHARATSSQTTSPTSRSTTVPDAQRGASVCALFVAPVGGRRGRGCQRGYPRVRGGVELEVRRGQRVVELFGGARSEDHGRDGRMRRDPGHGERGRLVAELGRQRHERVGGGPVRLIAITCLVHLVRREAGSARACRRPCTCP